MRRLKLILGGLLLLGLCAVAALLLTDDPHARRRPATQPTPVTVTRSETPPVAEARDEPVAGPAEAEEPPAEWPADAPRLLYGTVTNPAGEPVAGATVLVVAGRKDRRAQTDREGRFRLADVPGKADRLEVSARGYTPSLFERPAFPAAPKVRWDVTLEPAQGVHGIVLSGSEPAAEAWVVLRRTGQRRPVAATRADHTGRFALEWPGEPPLELFARHGQFGEATLVVEGPGEVTVELPGGGYVAGRVVDEEGQPVPSFSVSASPMASRAGGPPAQSFDDRAGQFLLGPLSPGTTRVWAAAEGYQPGEASDVAVRTGETTDGVVLKLKRSTVLEGRVTDARTRRPVEGALVIPAEWQSSALAEAVGSYTDADGRYRLDALPGTRTTIHVTAPGYYPLMVGGVEGPVGQRVVRDFSLTAQRKDQVPGTQLTGIGAVLMSRRDGIVIGQLLDGGPAAEALQKGDVIVMVGDDPVRGGDVGPVAQAIRGEEGTDVVLWVKRGGQGEPERVVITRGRVTMPDRHHRVQ